MTCDLCADPASGGVVRLCAACAASPADRRQRNAAALDRRRRVREECEAARWRTARRQKARAGVCVYNGCTRPTAGRWFCEQHRVAYAAQ